MEEIPTPKQPEVGIMQQHVLFSHDGYFWKDSNGFVYERKGSISTGYGPFIPMMNAPPLKWYQKIFKR